MSVKDKPQTETLAERYGRTVAAKNLERLRRNLDNTKDEVGFVAWAVEKAEQELWNEVDRDPDEAPVPRDELPTVTLEDVGRLHIFADDLDRCIQELQEDAQRIRRVGHAFHGSNAADDMKGDDA